MTSEMRLLILDLNNVIADYDNERLKCNEFRDEVAEIILDRLIANRLTDVSKN